MRPDERDELAGVMAALAQVTRLDCVLALLDEPDGLRLTELARWVNRPAGALKPHLDKLLAAGLIRRTVAGSDVWFEATVEAAMNGLQALCAAGAEPGTQSDGASAAPTLRDLGAEGGRGM